MSSHPADKLIHAHMDDFHFLPTTTLGKLCTHLCFRSQSLRTSGELSSIQELWCSSSSPNLPLKQVQEMESVFPILYFLVHSYFIQIPIPLPCFL